MSEFINNFNTREISRRLESRGNPIQPPQNNQRVTDDEGVMGESYRESTINRECRHNINMPVGFYNVRYTVRRNVVEGEQAYATLPSPWPVGHRQLQNRAQNDQTMEETSSSEASSETELELICEEGIPVCDIRFYNPNYHYITLITNGNTENPTGIFLHNPTNLPILTQVNSSCFHLHSLPGSMELTRNQPRPTWADYHARVRESQSQIRGSYRARPPCSGQLSNQMPMYMNEELGSVVFIRNDSDSEEECTPAPLALVPRRGNSVSDLSQCSSDDEAH